MFRVGRRRDRSPNLYAMLAPEPSGGTHADYLFGLVGAVTVVMAGGRFEVHFEQASCGVVVGMQQSSSFGPSFEPANTPGQVPDHPTEVLPSGCGVRRGRPLPGDPGRG